MLTLSPGWFAEKRFQEMQVLILDDQIERRTRLSALLSKLGIRVFLTGDPKTADSTIRNSVVDLFIAQERIGGKLTHSLVLLAEYRNPLASAILLTDRTDPDVDELFLLIPALHCLLATDCPPELIRKLAIACMAGATDQRDRLVLASSMRVGDNRSFKPGFFSRRFVTHAPTGHHAVEPIPVQ